MQLGSRYRSKDKPQMVVGQGIIHRNQLQMSPSVIWPRNIQVTWNHPHWNHNIADGSSKSYTRLVLLAKSNTCDSMEFKSASLCERGVRAINIPYATS